MKNKILETSKKQRKILSIRLYGEDDEFWLGYVEDYNPTIIQLRYFDLLGLEDGTVIIQQENIESIEFNSEYEKSYEYIINIRNSLDNIPKIVEFKNGDDWRTQYLSDLKKRKEVISFKTDSDITIYGFVDELNESDFLVNPIGHLGENEGNTIYKIDDISSFWFGSKKSKLRQELSVWRKKK
ncbi:MAG: hypothetical protein ACK4VN_06700 [Bacteroidales bacterium]